MTLITFKNILFTLWINAFIERVNKLFLFLISLFPEWECAQLFLHLQKLFNISLLQGLGCLLLQTFLLEQEERLWQISLKLCFLQCSPNLQYPYLSWLCTFSSLLLFFRIFWNKNLFFLSYFFVHKKLTSHLLLLLMWWNIWCVRPSCKNLGTFWNPVKISEVTDGGEILNRYQQKFP